MAHTCVCAQCARQFTSRDFADYETDALCKDCLKRRKENGYKADEKVRERRRNSPPKLAPMAKQVVTQGGRTFIRKNLHYKELLNQIMTKHG